MVKRKQYKNPPLVEVFTEFFFQPAEGVEWDSFLVPKYFKAIARDFPNRKRMSSVGIQVRMAGDGTSPEFQQIGPPTPRHRFTSENEKTLVQLGDNLLVVNQLPPYYGWEKYAPTVVECFGVYARLWKPQRAVRAGVHYIDKIDLPEVETGLERYFNLLPVLPEFPPEPATNLTMSYEVPGANTGDILVVTMKQQPSANPDGMTFLFQWDYVATGGLPNDRSAVQTWLDQAHDYLSRLFLNTFTHECRKLFD